VSAPDLAGVRDLVIACAHTCGDVTVERSGATTHLRAAETFATIKVGKRAVELRLVLPGGHRLPGIVKLLTGGEDAVRHTVRLRTIDDVDDEVRSWLCEAYSGAASG
jgi:hypothetical protein